MQVDPQIAIILLTALSAATVLLALVQPGAAAADLRRARLQAVAGVGARPAVTDDGRRRKLVENTLREMEAKQQAARSRSGAKPTLIGRMRQAGLTWSKKVYFSVAVVSGLVAGFLVMLLSGLGAFPALAFGAAAGVLLPHLYVSRKRTARFAKFTREFPDAVDVIVRGVKAGLPLADCLKTIASEAQEPVRSEFKALVQDQLVGVPLDEGVQRLARRMPLPEANFFAVVIAIQSRSGGNLSEALGNLAKVLRERKKMKSKVKAVSSEAKASAGIIGSIPVVVSILIYLSSPDYITLLFTTTVGNFVLAGCVFWMTIGVLVMRKMINFDF